MEDLEELGKNFYHILKKIASGSIKYTDLLSKYQSEGTEKLTQYLKNSGNSEKARITKDMIRCSIFFEKN